METLGADRSRITAVVGPSMAQAAYEVGPEFVENFTQDDPGAAQYFMPGLGDRSLFDMQGYSLNRLTKSGVAQARWIGHCTYASPDDFYSYRRSVHRKEPDYGRLIACIRL